MKESEIQKACLQYLMLRKDKGFFWRTNQSTSFYRPELGRMIKQKGIGYINGVADILGVTHNGRFAAFEIKQPGKKPTEEQTLFIDEIRKRGGHAYVITNLDELKVVVDDL